MTYLKVVMLIVAFTVIAAKVVTMRQQRFAINHEIARMHQQMDDARQSLWESQVRVAEQLKPTALEHKLSVAQMKLEPISTSNGRVRRFCFPQFGSPSMGGIQREPVSHV